MSLINRRNNSSKNFVERWEDLPPGDWLDTDEDGTHWYLANDGRHWFSTDQGYEVWVNEEEEAVKEEPKPQRITFPWEEEDDDEDDEDDEVKIKLKKQRLRPDLGALPGVIGVLMALVLLSYTFFFVVPATEEQIEVFESSYWPEFASDYETVQEFNYIALGILGFIMFISILNLLVKVWWFVMPLCLIALIGILIHTANISTVSWNAYEQVFFEDCEQEFEGCPEPNIDTIFLADSMFSGYCGGLAFLIIGMRTLSGILNFEYDEEDDDEDYDFYGY
ncbi:MAG: hypothetical protein ACPHUK_02960 [Candidatus Poseidoniaceae archaeon]